MGNCVLAEVAAVLERFIAVALLFTTVKVAGQKYLANRLIFSTRSVFILVYWAW